jgi:hypothetical protein
MLDLPAASCRAAHNAFARFFFHEPALAFRFIAEGVKRTGTGICTIDHMLHTDLRRTTELCEPVALISGESELRAST